MKKLIYGNWKMNLLEVESVALIETLAKTAWPDTIELAVFPSFTSISHACAARGANMRLHIGAQDCFWEAKGAYTGEVSPTQLREFNLTRVLIGHSERRQYLGETDEMVNRKIKAAISAGLTPVLCVGETDEDRRRGLWTEVIARQTSQGLAGLAISGTQRVVIAYEPIWAVGSGRPCDPNDAREAHALIRNTLIEMFGGTVAQQNFSVIYGGSVDADNIVSYLSEEGIDGALIGGASQKSATFLPLIEAASKQ